MTVEQADYHVSYRDDKTADERLNAACFIINQIFDVTPSSKIDVSITDKRKHNG
jgi:translation initiation factor 2B subunit (eIF-2B alpha/beta/delta family)